jgi:hypothetical protein
MLLFRTMIIHPKYSPAKAQVIFNRALSTDSMVWAKVAALLKQTVVMEILGSLSTNYTNLHEL